MAATLSGAGASHGASVAVDAPDALIGRTVGAYRLKTMVGEGGMGTVYLAEHTMIGRSVAIKLLAREVARDPDAVSRFFTEARSVNQIRHPNIVEVTDLGDFEGRPFIVMEFLEGETLGDRLEREPVLPVVTAIHIARQATSALGAAHHRGMVHRDLKPANIFLRQHPDYPDFVKVLDFGITKLMEPGADVSHHTMAGTVMGTPAYMSPEQCLGEASLDHRSDVYSLGVVLYQAVTGVLPFQENTLGRLIIAHVNQMPRAPVLVNPRIPAELSAIILCSMAKKPSDRFASMRDMRMALEAIGAFDGTPMPIVGGESGPISAGISSSSMGLPTVKDAFSRPAGGERRNLTPFGLPIVRTPEPVAVRPSGEYRVAAGAMAEDSLAQQVSAALAQRLGGPQEHLHLFAPSLAPMLQGLRQQGLSFAQLAAVVEKDRRVASQVIRLANSAAFPSRATAKTVEQSVGRLGAIGLNEALIEFAVRPVLEAKEPRIKELYRRPWARALAVAMAADATMKELGQSELASAVYVAGLCHDVGRPIIAQMVLALERQICAGRPTRALSDEILARIVDSGFRRVSADVARTLMAPGSALRGIESAGDSPARGVEDRSIGSVLRFATALAGHEGLYLRRGAEVTRDALAATCAPLGLDEKALGRISYHLKERADLMATLRGL